MKARLFSRFGTLADVSVEFEREVRIGRGADNDVPLQTAAVSQRHARIHYDEEGKCYILEDLGSRNGTQVDGLPVRRPEPLNRIHVITIARSFDLVFQDLERCPVSATAGRAQPPRPAADPASRASATYALEIEGEDGRCMRIALRDGENVVGRELGVDVHIPLPQVSRRHALLRVRDGKVTVEDLKSSNGTVLDGARLDGDVEIRAGAQLRFGGISAVLVETARDPD